MRLGNRLIRLRSWVAMMVVMPLVFYPFSKTIFLAFDLFFRPATASETTP